MSRESATKIERLRCLAMYLDSDPFLTDEDLAQIFKVSVQTIRLDRTVLKIPEHRQRLKNVAMGKGTPLRTLSGGEVVGELLDLDVGRNGTSILYVNSEMTLSKTGVLRGHHLFAQANSLAVAVINAEAALTGIARVSFKQPVYCGEKVLAKAIIKSNKGNKYMVKVSSYVKGEVVFLGKFIVFAIAEEVPQ